MGLSELDLHMFINLGLDLFKIQKYPLLFVKAVHLRNSSEKLERTRPRLRPGAVS